jgi:GNAT superfamily N-acetyltransferase
VRRATAEDAPFLAELRWSFRSPLGEVTEDRAAFTARCSAWMGTALGPGSRWRAWVAERGPQVVGGIWLQVIEKIPNPVVEPECHAYISNLYVMPEARGHGVGKALLDAALRDCRALHPHAVILWPTERSRSLYTRVGFAAPKDILTRPGWDDA